MHSHSSQEATIRAALSSLLTRPQGSFLIIEEPKSGKFARFAGSQAEDLIFDLPLQTLSPDELTRATVVLHELGISDPTTYQTREYPGDAQNGEQNGLLLRVGTDVEPAVQVALAVFYRAYGFDEGTELQLTEG